MLMWSFLLEMGAFTFVLGVLIMLEVFQLFNALPSMYVYMYVEHPGQTTSVA